MAPSTALNFNISFFLAQLLSVHDLLQDGIARIVISPITANHGGHIKCQLSNQAGKASHEARLYVRCK